MAADWYRMSFGDNQVDFFPYRDVFDHEEGNDCMCGPLVREMADGVTYLFHTRLALEAQAHG